MIPHDAPKLDALAVRGEVGYAMLRGVSASIAELRETLNARTQSVVSGANGGALDAIWPDRRSLLDLARLPEADLLQARVDVATLRIAVREHERLAELRRHHDELAAELAPLAKLIERLNAYVAGSAA